MNIRTIVFDFDGTLHNTLPLYRSAFLKAYQYLVEQGQAEPRIWSNDEIRHWLGMSKGEMWKNFMPRLAPSIQEKSSRIIGETMDRELPLKGRLYDGVTETLKELKVRGYNLALLSNCRADYLKEHRMRWGLDRYIDRYYPAEKYGFLPKKDIFRTIQEECTGQYLMVGDRQDDMQVGVTHDVPTVGCTYGFGANGELNEAALHINAFPEILSVLL